MQKKKVLIIDDEVDFCLLMQFYLSKKNCDVQISHTLKEGLGIIKSDDLDIVILDNNLPDGLGWRAARNILDVIPGVHLFLISANNHNKSINSETDNEDNDANLPDSRFHVVEKPISITQIDNFIK